MTDQSEPHLFKQPNGKPQAVKPKRRGKGLWFLFIAVALLFFVKGLLLGAFVKVQGKARAMEELEIKTLVEGILKEVYVENAQSVKEGEKLFEFQNDSLGIDLIRAIQEKEGLEEGVKRAQKILEHSKKRLEGSRVLLENGVIGKLEFEQVELEHSANEALLHEIRRRLEETSLKVKALQKEKESLSVTSPFEGIFLGDLRQRKETRFEKGETLGLVFNPKAFYLEAILPEKRAKEVKAGQKAQVRFKAFPGVYPGKVIQVDQKAGEEIEKVFKIKHVIRARILLERFPEGLRPGMRGEAKLFPLFGSREEKGSSFAEDGSLD